MSYFQKLLRQDKPDDEEAENSEPTVGTITITSLGKIAIQVANTGRKRELKEYHQLTKLVIYLGLTAEFFENLADHGMLGIDPWSFKPLAAVNSKPEQSN